MSPYIWQGPLTKTGVIDVFKQKYLTPSIGSEFSDFDLVEALKSPNADALFRDLAITSRSSSPEEGRGVSIRIFFLAKTHDSFRAWCCRIP